MSGDLSERHNRKMEAESQMMQLSSQLSMLQKQVEEEVELHGKSQNDSLLELTLEEKEQLGKQVSFFEDEVRGVRQTIDEIQNILHREGEDLSVKEHWAKDLHSKCADQSAQLEHLGKQVSMLGEYLKRHLQLRNETDDSIDKEVQGRQKAEAQLTNLSTALPITVSAVETEDISIEHQQDILVDQVKEAEKLRYTDDSIDKEVQGRQQAEAQLRNLSTALPISVSAVETEDISIEHQPHILVDQVKEAEELRYTDDSIDKEVQGRQQAEAQLTNLSTALPISVSAVETEDISIEHRQHILVDQVKEVEKLRYTAEVSVSTLHTQIEQLEKVLDAAKNSPAVIEYQDKFVKQGLQTLVQLFLLALCVISLYSRVAEPAPLVPT